MKRLFVYKADLLYQVISKDVENRIFRHYRIFRYICINNPFWQRSGTKIFLCKYYTVILDALISFWICLLVACCNIIRASYEGKTELHKKVHTRICMRDITFLAARPPTYVIFCRFFLLFLLFRLLEFYIEKKKFTTENC